MSRSPTQRLVLDLWACQTRHPDYFGDALQWWAFGLFALSVPNSSWTLIGPALMTFQLLRISGMHLLERGLRRTNFRIHTTSSAKGVFAFTRLAAQIPSLSANASRRIVNSSSVFSTSDK